MTLRFTEEGVRRKLRRHIASKGFTDGDYAVYLGFSPAFISMVLKGKKRPCKEILRDLGLKRVVLYERISK
jgi:predicted transcriptional regulator